MISKKLDTIFKKGSTTYYYSSLFFPPDVKKDVFILYSFVRTADDFVDGIPAKKKDFTQFVQDYYAGINKGGSENTIIQDFILLQRRKGFKQEWIDAFLDVMKQDLTKKKYSNERELEEYMYGSAGVVGLMMAKILNLPAKSMQSAQLLGKAMQYINFIRDVQEDLSLGRMYFPQNILKKYGLKTLQYDEVQKNEQVFRTFIFDEISRYQTWINEAQLGFKHIPKRYLIPIKTASNMYDWTAQSILKNPMIIYEKKVKPKPMRVILEVIKNSLIT